MKTTLYTRDRAPLVPELMNAAQLQNAINFYQRGQADQAAAICIEILQREPNQPDALHVLGNVAKDRGQFEQAMQFFRQGLGAAPNHVHLLNSLGLLLRTLGHPTDAAACFEQAIKVNPGYVHARYNLANLCRAQDDDERAKALYREVIKQQGNFADALANLSSILEGEHQLGEARTLAKKAVKIDPRNYMARLTLANLAKRKQKYDEVRQHLAPLVENGGLSPINFTVAAGLLAQAQERSGRYAEAFELYQRANDAMYQMHVGPLSGLRSMYAPESLATLLEYFDGHRPLDPPDPADGYRTPAFLVGFPRSGTTLLDQVLSSHSRIAVLEEKENLEALYNHFPALPERLDELMSSSPAELQEWRDKLAEL